MMLGSSTHSHAYDRDQNDRGVDDDDDDDDEEVYGAPEDARSTRRGLTREELDAKPLPPLYTNANANGHANANGNGETRRRITCYSQLEMTTTTLIALHPLPLPQPKLKPRLGLRMVSCRSFPGARGK